LLRLLLPLNNEIWVVSWLQ